MAKGNEIIISPECKGRFMEGYVNTGETPKPGQIVQLDPTQAQIGGRFVWKLANMDGDGTRPKGPFIVLLPDHLRGKTALDAYAAGDRCFGYCPQPGDELNLLWANVSGTATIPAGTIGVVDDTTGKMIATPGGAEETEPAMLLEDIVDNTADQLAWSVWSGY
jgi:hypothetical protein